MLENSPPLVENRPDEPVRSEFSLGAAVCFLDGAALNWQKDRKCFACHTDYAFLFTRPLVSWKTPVHGTIRSKLEYLAEHPRDVKYRVTEAVMVASVLAQNDVLTTGKLHPTTRNVLDRMWSMQCEDGGFFGPETPRTRLLCQRIQEYLKQFPIDWLLLDWFAYGSLVPNGGAVQPADFVKKPFERIIGRAMPDEGGGDHRTGKPDLQTCGSGRAVPRVASHDQENQPQDANDLQRALPPRQGGTVGGSPDVEGERRPVCGVFG